MRAYLPILITTLLAVGLGVTLLTLAYFAGRVPKSRTSGTTYESGVPPVGNARERFSIKFYMVAVLFILFDLEIIFLVPWAVAFRQLGLLGLIEMAIFVAILVLGLWYVWKKGALEWQ